MRESCRHSMALRHTLADCLSASDGGETRRAPFLLPWPMPQAGTTQAYRPRPRDFREVYLRIGWDGIEDHFRANWRTVRRWIEEEGRDELRAARRAVVERGFRERREARKRRPAQSVTFGNVCPM